MRILVLSDSHGSCANVKAAILQESGAQAIIHLGDGSDDVLLCPEALGSRLVYLLKGNVDSGAYGATATLTSVFEGTTIFACHGDKYFVRNDTNQLVRAALSEGATIILFGHTHSQYYRYDNGLHIINPGSIKDGCYAVIDIRNEGILCNHKHL